MTEDKKVLLELLRQRAYREGDFTLASGQKSTYYIDLKNAVFHGRVASLLARCLWDLVRLECFDTIGGLEVGAIPLVTLLCMYASDKLGLESMEGFFVRKQAKDHGSEARIEGVLRSGAHVLIVEDVTTTGESALRAVDAATWPDTSVVAVATVVDRLQGAEERVHAAGYPFYALFTIRDFGAGALP